MRRSLRASLAWLYRRTWRLRACTLGVRVIVLDGERVLLVRHTYAPGWYLPGGGVDRGESAEGAAVRELREEGGIAPHGRPRLHGFFRHGPREHVACYLVRGHERAAAENHELMREIAEAAFFPLDALPPDTTAATRRRIDEISAGQSPSIDW